MQTEVPVMPTEKHADSQFELPSTVTPLVASDVREFLALAERIERDARSRGAAAGESWPAETLAGWTRQNQISIWVMKNESKIAAFLVLQQNSPQLQEILALAVDPPLRRQGLSRRLLEYTWQHGRPSPPQEWWLEVHERNLGAQRLYEQLGFRRVGRRPRYYADQSAAILLTLART